MITPSPSDAACWAGGASAIPTVCSSRPSGHALCASPLKALVLVPPARHGAPPGDSGPHLSGSVNVDVSRVMTLIGESLISQANFDHFSFEKGRFAPFFQILCDKFRHLSHFPRRIAIFRENFREKQARPKLSEAPRDPLEGPWTREATKPRPWPGRKSPGFRAGAQRQRRLCRLFCPLEAYFLSVAWAFFC